MLFWVVFFYTYEIITPLTTPQGVAILPNQRATCNPETTQGLKVAERSQYGGEAVSALDGMNLSQQ